MVLTLLLGTALARPAIGLSLGYEASVNDSDWVTHGPRVGVAVAFSELIEVGASVAYYPHVGYAYCDDAHWTAGCYILSITSLTIDYSIEISLLTAAGDLELRILPFRANFGKWQTAVGLAAGPGLVFTEDDLVVMNAEDLPADSPAQRTANELHPSVVGGLIGEVRGTHLGARFRLRGVGYIETINSSDVEQTSFLFAGAEGFWWF